MTSPPGYLPGRVGRAEIARAVPPGSRRLRGRRIERLLVDELAVDEELLQRRADFRAHVLDVARWLARHASYEDGTTRPGRRRICELAGISVSTFKACRRWLAAHHYLATVREGITQQFSRAWALLDENAPGEAAVYVLALPRRKPQPGNAPAPSSQITRPPTGSRSESVPRPAREAPGEGETGPAFGRAHPPGPVAAVAAALRKHAGQGITDGWVSHLAGPFLAAGWTGPDVLWAVDHDPLGAQHRLSAVIRHPAGWLRWRLAQWLGPDGQPLASAREQRARARAAAAADRAAYAAAFAAAAARRVDPAGPAAAIRAALGWRPR
jgi:hypothetical protein